MIQSMLEYWLRGLQAGGRAGGRVAYRSPLPTRPKWIANAAANAAAANAAAAAVPTEPA